ncbi:hypothetical protein [Pedobacter helvus]|uniref:Uncharacterized protein n=1 Tax=Pedobacter helvus TaxID=2563444 RepID=A0ABW9JDZ4_9SPHI|nr:hypothetical protein [Pedobacter ureilyticus]
MKRTILSAVMLASFVGMASAQTVNGIKLSDLKEEYLEVSVFEKTFSKKQFVFLEYGQNVREDFDAGVIKDEKGKPLPFNSLIEFVNHMKKYDYEVSEVYTVRDGDSRVKKFFVLKLKL